MGVRDQSFGTDAECSRESSGPGPVAGSPHAVLGALSRPRRSSRLRRGVRMPLPAPPAGRNCSTHATRRSRHSTSCDREALTARRPDRRKRVLRFKSPERQRGFVPAGSCPDAGLRFRRRRWNHSSPDTGRREASVRATGMETVLSLQPLPLSRFHQGPQAAPQRPSHPS